MSAATTGKGAAIIAALAYALLWGGSTAYLYATGGDWSTGVAVIESMAAAAIATAGRVVNIFIAHYPICVAGQPGPSSDRQAHAWFHQIRLGGPGLRQPEPPAGSSLARQSPRIPE